MGEEAGKRFEEIGTEGRRVGTETEKCPSCGSNMVFDPENGCLSCPHCGTKVEFQKDETAQEIDLSSAFGKDRQWNADEAVVFSCDNCGAKVVLKAGQTAKICPFCGTAHVRKTEELAGLKPNGLIPFAFGEEKAVEYSKAWAKKRFFAPGKFKKRLTAENVNGVYTPCFTFDSNTSSVYNGRIGTTHTRTVGSGKNRRTETYVVWRNISGAYYYNFNDVLITAGSKLDQKKLDKLRPYDTDSGKVYEENYLLGFMAYQYDDGIEDCWNKAKAVMDKELKRAILSQYTYDRVDYINVSTRHERVTYKYVMLPVYVGNYSYKKKLFNFYVNGETGKTWGKYPKSVPKILSFVLLGAAIVALGVWLYLSGGGS